MPKGWDENPERLRQKDLAPSVSKEVRSV